MWILLNVTIYMHKSSCKKFGTFVQFVPIISVSHLTSVESGSEIKCSCLVSRLNWAI